MTTCYIIDTSSLVGLNRTNPIDVFPSIWVKLEGLSKHERLLAPKEVLKEIEQHDDQLSKWAKKQKKMFKEPTDAQIAVVREILKEYPSLINADSKCSADPWVIALAIELMTSSQTTLVEVKRIVVTEEKLRGNQVRIPYVCSKKAVDCIDIVGLFRAEGWRF